MKGIYGYLDKKDNSIVYVGKDSNLEINKRHYDHLSPSKYKAQPFNRILQNNPNRYVYKRLYVCPSHLDEVDLNGLEMQYIEALNPKFNFTIGGDGSNGFKHSLETRKKISELQKGKNHCNYGKHLPKETRRKISETLKGRKRPDQSEQKKGKNNPLWKDYARVIKRGKTKSGKPTYSLRYNGKYLKHSVDYDKLQEMADDINKTKLEV